MSQLPLDGAGRRRSPATMSGFTPVVRRATRAGAPADPPTIEEIVAVMRHAGNGLHGQRLRGLIVVLWRAGLRVHEALGEAGQCRSHPFEELLHRLSRVRAEHDLGTHVLVSV
jgi:hypothetical protein